MTSTDLEGTLRESHGEMYSWAVTCCRGDYGEAEELLQETYLRVLDGRLSFRGDSSFKTWLFAVLRRAALDRRRRVAARLALLGRWVRPAVARPGRQEQHAIADEQAQKIRALLASVSARQRQVLELVFYHELALREAAEVMGVSIGTASRHYHRGKRVLLAKLEEAGLER